MDVDLDPDRPGRDPVEGEGLRGGEHGADGRRPRRTGCARQKRRFSNAITFRLTLLRRDIARAGRA